jgi:two-component system, NtrC family, sensor kinase
MFELGPTLMEPSTPVDHPGMPVASPNEEARLRALARYAILDTQPDAAFDDLRCLAQRVSNCSVGAIAFFDRDRVWFKSMAGLDQTECPRDSILESSSTTVKAHPGGPFQHLADVGRVAWTPFVTDDGYVLGCLIVADPAPGDMGPERTNDVAAIARQVVRLLELRRTLLSYHTVIDGAGNVVFHLDEDGRLVSLTPTWASLTGFSVVRSVGQRLSDFVHEDDRARVSTVLANAHAAAATPIECRLCRLTGDDVAVEVASRSLVDEDGRALGLVGVIADITERQAREVEAQHLQKLEALGRLSAGLAHEINTPIQFVGDNARFLAESYEAMLKLVLTYRRILDTSSGAISWWERQELVQAAEAEADVDYLAEEVPTAVKQSLEGVERVASLVRAMKTFSHPGTSGQAAADLNEALRATMTVARNQIRYIADPVLDLGDVPPVVCNIADLNQVFLNMVLNAADAIQEKGDHGTITVLSRQEADEVMVTISDTGAGIPRDLQRRIFEPFFTTKEVGRGTGQGLALARAIICDQHSGKLTLKSEIGVGTTFTIRLPIAGRPVAAGEPA